MKSSLSLVLFCLLASAPSDEIEFGISKGTKLTKEFTMSLELEKKDASFTVGEREMPKELLDKMEMNMTFGESIEIEDEYVEMDGARPKELIRHYRKATNTSSEHTLMPGSEPTDKKKERESPLADHDVAFTWNAKENEYERAFRGEKADSKLLEKLKEDTDLRKLLPEGSVKVGDTWKLDAKVFDDLVTPGGNLHFKDDAEDKADDDSDFDLEKNATGEIEAKYAEKREVDGAPIAVITLKAHIASHSDKAGKGDAPMKMEITFDVEGEFLWDLEHKHVRSYEMHGPAEVTIRGSTEIEANGKKAELKMRFDLEGEMKAGGTFGS
jgi:hypothetical protein